MLVLSRKRGDAVAMGERHSGAHAVKVTVLDIRGAQVKLGFEAAGHIAVHRWEVWERIRAEHGDAPAPAVAAPGSAADHWADDGGPMRPAELPAAPRPK